MSSKTATKTKRKASKRSSSRTAAKRTHAAKTIEHHLQHPEKRERFYRAKRALRTLKHTVLFPKAVIHTNKARVPEQMLNEVPEQALIEHWEAIGELKDRGIEVRSTSSRSTKPHFMREIELDGPISAHARNFASDHGIIVRERKHPLRSSLERIFG
ncbi:MAG: hypothetical protein AABX02_03755 [archaeon]